MSPRSLGRLVLLAALWGGSFLFLRIGVPSFGAAWIIEWRVFIAFLCLVVAGLVMGRRVPWRGHWRHYALLGLLNSALPFLLFAYAAQSLPASLLSVFNSTAPIWGALLGIAFLGQAVTLSEGTGLGLGVAGVAWLATHREVGDPAIDVLPVLAAMLAPLCYALASAYSRRAPAEAGGAFENTVGSMGASSLLVLPLCLLWPMPGTPDAIAWGSALALGVLCTGIAYLLYFQLIADEGPMKALAVTFLIPIFGTLWGVLFLGERLTANLLGGGALILAGTLLTTGTLRLPGRRVGAND